MILKLNIAHALHLAAWPTPCTIGQVHLLVLCRSFQECYKKVFCYSLEILKYYACAYAHVVGMPLAKLQHQLTPHLL